MSTTICLYFLYESNNGGRKKKERKKKRERKKKESRSRKGKRYSRIRLPPPFSSALSLSFSHFSCPACPFFILRDLSKKKKTQDYSLKKKTSCKKRKKKKRFSLSSLSLFSLSLDQKKKNKIALRCFSCFSSIYTQIECRKKKGQKKTKASTKKQVQRKEPKEKKEKKELKKKIKGNEFFLSKFSFFERKKNERRHFLPSSPSSLVIIARSAEALPKQPSSIQEEPRLRSSRRPCRRC